MPVTTQASGTLDKPYEDGNPSSPTSFTSQDLRGAEGSNLSPNGSISSYSRTNSFDSLDGSNSSTSSNYGGGHSRQISNDSSASGADYIPTRSIKQASKAQHNPLQFVKVGTSNLYKKAEEQIKKYEEVKKLKVMEKTEEEDWQHNLDNWKSKRRQSSHKPLDRTDEFQRFEEEYKQKPRRKSKTFSEMVEERSKRGRNFGYFSDEWEEGDKNSCHGSDSPRHDLSLESSCTGDAFHEDESDASSVDKNHLDSGIELKEKAAEVNGVDRSSEPNTQPSPSNGHENGTKDNSTHSNNEEYTFDKAIQSYVQYAESQKKTNREKKTTNGTHQPLTKKSSESPSLEIMQEKEESAPKMADVPVSFSGERTGGTEMAIIVKLKSSSERDFGFTTRSQGRGIVFVDTVSSRGSAEWSGLKVDDEVLAINGESVSNRSHSAIVFAIKQAVYTGQLELRIYRYDDTQQVLKQNLNGATAKKPSRVEERKAVFSKEGSCEKEPSPEKRVMMREQSPKVDILKRRSLFESPPRDVDLQQHRHSVDAVTGWKNKAPSMDNLHTVSKVVDSNEEASASKPTSDTKKINKKLDFKKKLASFENLETAGKTPELKPVSSERKQSLKDRIASFEKVESSVERSRSYDQLDFSSQKKPAPVVKHDISLPNFKEQSDEVDGDDYSVTNGMHHDAFFEELLGPPRIIDVMTKEDSPPAPVLEVVAAVLAPSNVASSDSAVAETKPEVLDLPEPKAEMPVVEEPVQKVVNIPQVETTDHNECMQAIGNANDCMISRKADFELADSLEETAFLGSLTEKELGNAEFDSCKSEESIPEPSFPPPINQDQIDFASLNEISMETEGEQLDMSNLGEELIVVDDFDFDAPPRFLEPPKEKPPPPPTETEMHPEHADVNGTNLKRIDSTKRIKKELRRLRTDFLGFETPNDQINLDVEVKSVPKLNSQKSVNSSPKEKEAANKPKKAEKITSAKKDSECVPSKPSEDDDLARKEQQIIDDLEREEQLKLANLEKKGIESEPPTPVNEPSPVEPEKPKMEEPATKISLDEEVKLREREEQLRMQEEVLRLEREKLRLEQEELKRQREEYIKQIQHHQSMYPPPINNVNNRKEISNETADPLSRCPSENNIAAAASHSPVVRNNAQPPTPTNVVSSPGELRRDEIIRLSRQPGLEMPRNSPTEENFTKITNGSESMATQPQKQVSARPPLKAKQTNGEKCIARRKQEPNQRNPAAYNQHWLIQEAEMRRINEQNGHMQKSRSLTREQPVAENGCSQQRTITSPNLSAPNSRRQNKQNGVSKDSSVPYKNVAKKLPGDQQPPLRSERKDLEIPMSSPQPPPKTSSPTTNGESQMLSVSGKKKCSHCGDELGKGAAMIIESLHLFYHIHCFKCCVCHVQLGNGLSGADVRVRNQKLHCHNCYSNDEAGLKFSKV